MRAPSGARERLEAYQLTHEQDALFARLGRAYHSGADLRVLEALRAEIRQLEEQLSHLGPPTETPPPEPPSGVAVRIWRAKEQERQEASPSKQP